VSHARAHTHTHRGLRAASLLARVEGVLAASAGAACHSTGDKMSAVLVAMGVAPEFGVNIYHTKPRVTAKYLLHKAACHSTFFFYLY
jgi:hypothetical protein